MTYIREQLVDLCNKASVHYTKWRNRDSADAQRQVGELSALLKSNCPFEVVTEGSWKTDDQTIVVQVEFKGFIFFEEGELSKETFYLPTQKRLDEAAGGDWY